MKKKAIVNIRNSINEADSNSQKKPEAVSKIRKRYSVDDKLNDRFYPLSYLLPHIICTMYQFLSIF